MEYTKLGQTGLEVSKLCLGCMSFNPFLAVCKAQIVDCSSIQKMNTRIKNQYCPI